MKSEPLLATATGLQWFLLMSCAGLSKFLQQQESWAGPSGDFDLVASGWWNVWFLGSAILLTVIGARIKWKSPANAEAASRTTKWNTLARLVFVVDAAWFVSFIVWAVNFN